MGHSISKAGFFAMCLFIMILLQGCSTTENTQNKSNETIPTSGPTLNNSRENLTVSNPTQTSMIENGTAYVPKFRPGDIIDVPESEVGQNLAPNSGTVGYGRWIKDISYDNESIPVYDFSLVYTNETGNWYFTGYTGWKYSAYVDEVDNATLITHVDI
jgi:ABC-type Fe3+-hydroxamate transport system substrate-binding protein